MSSDLDQLPPLSDAGQLRRAEILSAAKRQASWRKTRRRIMCVGASCMIVGSFVMLFSMAARRQPLSAREDTAPAELPTPSPIAHDPAPAPAGPYVHFKFATIDTDDSLAAKYALAPRTGTVTILSDDQLLDSLHTVGIDAGLAQVGSQSLLVLNDTFKPSPAR